MRTEQTSFGEPAPLRGSAPSLVDEATIALEREIAQAIRDFEMKVPRTVIGIKVCRFESKDFMIEAIEISRPVRRKRRTTTGPTTTDPEERK